MPYRIPSEALQYPVMLLWLIIICILHPIKNSVLSYNTSPNSQNERFDPDSRGVDEDTVTCALPPFQDTTNYIRPEAGRRHCSASSSLSPGDLTDEEIQDIAVKYAPALFLHPLEEFTPQNPDAIFLDPSRGKIYRRSSNNETELVDDTLNLTTMVLLRDQVEDVFFTPFFFEYNDKDDDYKQGAGFEEDNNVPLRRNSKANLYYNIIDYSSSSRTWVINYHIYFTWQGAGTFAFGVGDRRYSLVELDPFGSHEGDWEGLSVMICAPDISPPTIAVTLEQEQPLAVHYQQHSFGQIVDCTKGECTFWKEESNHPVGFVGHKTHAIYPFSAEAIPYAFVPLSGNVFAPGFMFLSDPTTYRNTDTGEYRMLNPTKDNIVRLIEPKDVVLGVTPPELLWMAWLGQWGGNIEFQNDRTAVPPSVRCMNEAQTEYLDECPNVPLTNAIVKALQSDILDATTRLVPAVSQFTTLGTGPTGPANKDYYYDWVAPESAQLYFCGSDFFQLLDNEDAFCFWLGTRVIDDTTTDEDYRTRAVPLGVAIGLQVAAVVSNVIGFFVDCFST